MIKITTRLEAAQFIVKANCFYTPEARERMKKRLLRLQARENLRYMNYKYINEGGGTGIMYPFEGVPPPRLVPIVRRSKRPQIIVHPY